MGPLNLLVDQEWNENTLGSGSTNNGLTQSGQTSHHDPSEMLQALLQCLRLDIPVTRWKNDRKWRLSRLDKQEIKFSEVSWRSVTNDTQCLIVCVLQGPTVVAFRLG